MDLARFHLTNTGLTVNDTPVLAEHVMVDVGPDGATVTVVAPGVVDVAGEGIVQLVRDPTSEEIDAAAIDVIARIPASQLEARCARVLQSTGRRDVYQVVLDTIAEMARE